MWQGILRDLPLVDKLWEADAFMRYLVWGDRLLKFKAD
jgi:hypothetical protein